MKRRDLLRHLAQHGCAFLREGGNHTLYINRAAKKISTIPRHNEINRDLARKICKDLQVAPAARRLTSRTGCRRWRGPSSIANAGVGPAASSMWAVPARQPYASPAIAGGGRPGARARQQSRSASGSADSWSRRCWSPISTLPVPLGNPPSSAGGDPRAVGSSNTPRSGWKRPSSPTWRP